MSLQKGNSLLQQDWPHHTAWQSSKVTVKLAYSWSGWSNRHLVLQLHTRCYSNYWRSPQGVNSSSQPSAKWQLLDLEIQLVIGCRAEGKWAGGGGRTTCWWERSPCFSRLNLAPWPWLCSPASPRKFHFIPSRLEKAFSCMWQCFFLKMSQAKAKTNKQNNS